MTANLLAVRFKERVRKGWSYPVGAEILTAAFGDVPHASATPLHFWHSEPYFLEDRRRRVSEDLGLPVLRATYITHSSEVGAAPYERPRWEVTVFSVPSPLRHWIKNALVAVVLPRARTWLVRPRPELVLASHPSCRLLLHEEQGSFDWEETEGTFQPSRMERLSIPEPSA